jgi:hypothetical protein
MTTAKMDVPKGVKSREDLVACLTGHDLDFRLVYLPADAKTGRLNKFAIVDFGTAEAAEEARKCLERVEKEVFFGSVGGGPWIKFLAGHTQGLQANIERYRNSPLVRTSALADFRPLLFNAEGKEGPFPDPDPDADLSGKKFNRARRSGRGGKKGKGRQQAEKRAEEHSGP